MRPRLCLLDAGPVIELHRLGIWEGVVERTHLIIPSIVASVEAQFWDSGEGIGKPINLDPLIKSGSIEKRGADARELQETQALFDPSLVESIHAGELEALAILRTWGDDPPGFCTGDRLATIALCLLGFSHLAISLEGLLGQVGLRHRPRSPFRKSAMERWIQEGADRRIRGEGLR